MMTGKGSRKRTPTEDPSIMVSKKRPRTNNEATKLNGASNKPSSSSTAASEASRIQLEEEIWLLEQSIESLHTRKDGIDGQMEASHSRQRGIVQVLTTQLQRQHYLEASQTKHLPLLQDLQKSLTKSHDILRRLTSNASSSSLHLTQEEIQQLTEEIQRQEEWTLQQQQKQLQQEEESVQENDEQDIDVDLLGSHNDEASSDDSQDPNEQLTRCSVIPVHEDPARLSAFWEGHCHDDTTKNSPCLYSFIPCIGSQSSTLVHIMDIYATEALAKDNAIQNNLASLGDNNHTTNNKAADHRRQSLYNTCLDFVVMVGNSNNNNNNIKPVEKEPAGSTTEETTTDLPAEGENDSNDNTTTVEDTPHNPSSPSPLHLDPHVALCPFELSSAGGVCTESNCPYQHLNAETRPHKAAVLPRELLPLPTLKLPPDPPIRDRYGDYDYDVENQEEEDQGEDGMAHDTDQQQDEEQSNKSATSKDDVDDKVAEADEQSQHEADQQQQQQEQPQSPEDHDSHDDEDQIDTVPAGEEGKAQQDCQLQEECRSHLPGSESDGGHNVDDIDSNEPAQHQVSEKDTVEEKAQEELALEHQTEHGGEVAEKEEQDQTGGDQAIATGCEDEKAIMDNNPLGEGTDGDGTNSSQHQAGDDQPTLGNEFDADMDFIAFGEDSDGGSNSSDSEEGEDPTDLETAGLYLRMKQLDNKKTTEEKVEETQTEENASNGFWWWHEPSEDEYYGEGETPKTELPAFEEWLRQYGEFHLIRQSQPASLSEQLLLEYWGPSPTSAQEFFVITARVVDCARLMLHAGRFDLTEPLCSIAANVLGSTSAAIATSSMEGNVSAQNDEIRSICQQIVSTTLSSIRTAFSKQNGVRSTFRCQLLFAYISDLLQRSHHAISEVQVQSWAWCIQWIHRVSRLATESGESILMRESENRNRKKDAWFIRESIKQAVFCKKNSKDPSEDRHDQWERQISFELLSNVREAIAFASAVRVQFSLHTAADDFVKPIWTIVKSSLRQRGAETLGSSMVLRSVTFMGYVALGILEGAVDYLNAMESNHMDLSPLAFSSLVQLDATIFGIVKSISNTLRIKFNSPLLGPLLTPLVASSVSFSCRLGNYAKAQRRLEEVIGPSDNNVPNLMTYSELLWSQMIHLRSSLPSTQQAGKKEALGANVTLPIDVKRSHDAISAKVWKYDIRLHHVCLTGDWNLLTRMKAAHDDDSGQPMESTGEAERLKGMCASLLSDETETLAIGLQPREPTQSPASLRIIDSLQEECMVEFPLSFLVVGHKITSLSLASCQLRSLPHSFGRYLPNLRALDLSSNSIDRLPPSFGALGNLRSFLANDNMLQSLSPSFGKLAKLRKLQLRHNRFSSFPAPVRRLKQLEELQLEGNQFTLFDPAQLTLDLPQLRYFSAPEDLSEHQDVSEHQGVSEQPEMVNKNKDENIDKEASEST